MTTLESIDTPCLLLDRTKLERNLARMAGIAAKRGICLRPHLKTAKSLDVARLAVPDVTSPIAVSTLREAEYFSAQGYRDIFYAVGLGPGKLARVIRLQRNTPALITMLDNAAVAARLRAAGTEAKIRLRTVIELNCGENRGGVEATGPDLVVIAQILGEHFAGVSTHGGHSYATRSSGELAAAAEAEAGAVRTAVSRLKDAGMPCEIVSIGSTPTALAGVSLDGVTDFRAGVYMFGDLFQAGIGSCSLDDLALTVLAEVISRPANRPGFLIDAGAFALSKDLATAALPPERQAAFGWVCDIDGRLLPGLRVDRVWQEHGLVVSEEPLPPDAFPLGTRVRVLPNHACPTAAAHDRYQVVAGDRTVAAVWPRINHW